ncbi:MAG: DNA polymerase Y family protein [Gemmatimonadales bacterium]
MFAAVARLLDPEGAGRARLLVVGGRAESRGVVLSASYEARAFGVRAGMPIAQAVRLCPDALYVPVPRGAIGVKHREVRAVLDEWTPIVEPASVDEFYLDLSGTEQVYGGEPLATTAARIREAVLARTGLPVSFGGGTNRLIAKLAAERAKPKPGTGGRGVYVVASGDEGAFLAEHALAEIPGVGPRLQAELRRYGLTRVTDAIRVSAEDFGRWLGPRTGAWLFARIRGRGSGLVDPGADNKSMSHEETFGRDLLSDDALETRLLELVTSLGSGLRSSGLRTRTITVKLRDHDFRTRQAAHTLPEPVSSDRAIYAVARERLRSLRARRRVAARLLGVSLSGLSPGTAPAQLDLLDAPARFPESARDRMVSRAVDRINQKLGAEAIRPARLLEDRP